MKKVSAYIIAFYVILSCAIPGSRIYAQSQGNETPQFIFPAACHYGVDCWAVNYVDMDPDEGEVADFKCKTKTYDGHKGTDFALGSIAQMREGVDVLAATAGKVKRVRDGQSDTLKTEEELDAVRYAKKECGNGILIDHGDGLQTMYCHLKQDSVVVRPKQKVKTGEKIAQIGQSGAAEFPHLHFGVFWNGSVVDPYTGVLNSEGCGKKKESMWHLGLPMRYEPVAIFNGGFRDRAPSFRAIEHGNDVNPSSISLSSTALVFWVGFYNVEQGDEVIMDIYDPDGQKFNARKQIIEKTRARQYYYTGRKVGKVQLKKGVYKGIVKLTRSQKGAAVSKVKEFRIMVD